MCSFLYAQTFSGQYLGTPDVYSFTLTLQASFQYTAAGPTPSSPAAQFLVTSASGSAVETYLGQPSVTSITGVVPPNGYSSNDDVLTPNAAVQLDSSGFAGVNENGVEYLFSYSNGQYRLKVLTNPTSDTYLPTTNTNPITLLSCATSSSSAASPSAVSSTAFSSSVQSSSVASSSVASSSALSSSPASSSISSSPQSSSVYSSSAASSSVFSSSPASFSSSPPSSSSRFSSSVHSSSVFSSSRFSSSPASSSVSSSRHSSSVFSSSPASSSVSSSRVSSSAVSSSVFSSSLLSSSPVSSSVSSSLFSSSLQSSSPASSSVYSSSAQSSSVYSSSAESSSAQSSSAQSSSTYSSSAVSSSSSSQPPSSTSSASAYSDPRFVGFWGQQWYVEGVVGGVYNLLSDSQVQLNARFVYRSNVTCPVTEDGSPVERCFSEAGTYFGSIALRVTSGEWVTVAGGPVSSGFAAVVLSAGTEVAVGDEVEWGVETNEAGGVGLAEQSASHSCTTRPALQLQRLRRLLRGDAGAVGERQPRLSSRSVPQLSIHRPDARSLLVTAGAYAFTLHNMDGYVDLTRLESTCWQCVVDELRPQGLLGQTWNATAVVRGQSEAEVEAFREAHDELLGCQHVHDRFCRHAAPSTFTLESSHAAQSRRR